MPLAFDAQQVTTGLQARLVRREGSAGKDDPRLAPSTGALGAVLVACQWQRVC